MIICGTNHSVTEAKSGDGKLQRHIDSTPALLRLLPRWPPAPRRDDLGAHPARRCQRRVREDEGRRGRAIRDRIRLSRSRAARLEPSAPVPESALQLDSNPVRTLDSGASVAVWNSTSSNAGSGRSSARSTPTPPRSSAKCTRCPVTRASRTASRWRLAARASRGSCASRRPTCSGAAPPTCCARCAR